jgi:structural maintenance of chromosome 1
MDSDAMEVDDLSQRSIRSTDWTVQVDYSALDDDERQDNSSHMDKRFQADLKRRAQELSQMDPNLKAIDRLDGIEQRLIDLEEEYRTTRKAVETTRTQFDQVKRKR